MTIRTSCSACGVKLKVEDHLAGKTLRCPSCQQPITIPAAVSSVEIHDPFAEDAEEMASPPDPSPPRIPRQTENSPPKPASKSKSNPVIDQTSASPPPAKPVRQRKPRPATDYELPEDDDHNQAEFPDLSNDELHGEVISPPRRKSKKKPADSDQVASISKSPRHSTPPVVVPASVSGWRWHLHWVLAVALLPLILSNVFSSIGSLEDRLRQTIENHPELNPEALNSVVSLNDLAMQLPDHRLSGAWLPADTHWHWAMALASSVFFMGLFLGMWPTTENRVRTLITVGVATGTVGIFLLLGFQWLAFRTEGVFVRGRSVLILFFYIVKFIGFSYRCAIDSSSGFFASFIGYTLGVGLCEELCKALPIIIYLNTDRRKHSLRTACLIGLASGAGFGISEGITYANHYYNGIQDFWIYLVRFISCVSLHAIWTGGVAILMYSNQDYLSISWRDALSFVAFYLSPAMIMHGMYNTLLTHDYQHIAAVCAVASFAWLQWLLMRHASES